MTGPRVTHKDVEDFIIDEYYFTAHEGVVGNLYKTYQHNYSEIIEPPTDPLGLITFCVLVLKNNFTVIGYSSCVSPENFDYEIGKQISRERAKEQLWPLLGFALKQELHANVE